MQLRVLRETDLDDAMRLVRAADWNQCRGDWQRVLDLAPDTCFAGIVDDRVVATTTAVTYGDVAWIGMVLVAPGHRGNGHATRLFTHALESLGDDIAVGLDATDMGRPLYQKYGFESATPITRFSGTLPTGRNPDACSIHPDSRLEEVVELDSAACGHQRRALLERLASEPDTIGVVHDNADILRGYAFLRPGRTAWQVGPLVAETDRVLQELLTTLGTYADDAEVIIDAPGPDIPKSILGNAGLTASRVLDRMTRHGTDPLLTGESLVGAAGFEFG